LRAQIGSRLPNVQPAKVQKPTFIADADLNDKIVVGVRRREPGVDFVGASDGGTRGLSDPEVLALSAASERVLVSSDRRTMPAHFKMFLETDQSPGVIVVSQTTEIARAIDELVAIWREGDLDALRNQIRWVRRRR